jgi:hypothetical protein
VSARRGTQPESPIVASIRLALGREHDLVLWRNSVWSQRRAVPGLGVGSSDLIGCLAPHGRMVALEVKTDRGRASQEQILFLELVRSMGGFACVVRSADEARAALERARAGDVE